MCASADKRPSAQTALKEKQVTATEHPAKTPFPRTVDNYSPLIANSCKTKKHGKKHKRATG
jgi:hypothetical protein